MLWQIFVWIFNVLMSFFFLNLIDDLTNVNELIFRVLFLDHVLKFASKG